MKMRIVKIVLKFLLAVVLLAAAYYYITTTPQKWQSFLDLTCKKFHVDIDAPETTRTELGEPDLKLDENVWIYKANYPCSQRFLLVILSPREVLPNGYSYAPFHGIYEYNYYFWQTPNFYQTNNRLVQINFEPTVRELSFFYAASSFGIENLSVTISKHRKEIRTEYPK